MEKKMISVIVPVYNVEKYLPACLDSICHQTLKELEIILVDDGSTHNSGGNAETVITNVSGWYIKETEIRERHVMSG